jgi:hypothetical protein
VREFFQHSRRRHRLAQPETYLQPRTRQFALRFVLLLGRYRGITACGYAYDSYGWNGAVVLGAAVLLLPLGIGLMEITQERKSQINRE